jgi:hypothetical protein
MTSLNGRKENKKCREQSEKETFARDMEIGPQEQMTQQVTMSLSTDLDSTGLETIGSPTVTHNQSATIPQWRQEAKQSSSTDFLPQESETMSPAVQPPQQEAPMFSLVEDKTKGIVKFKTEYDFSIQCRNFVLGTNGDQIFKTSDGHIISLNPPFETEQKPKPKIVLPHKIDWESLEHCEGCNHG